MKLRAITAALFLLTACQQNSGPADFRKLAAEAYPAGSKEPDRAALDRLWVELYKLPQWHFTTTSALVVQKQPSIELIDGNSFLVAFTDLNMARAYARSRGPAPAAPPPAAAPTALGPSPFANAPVAAPAEAADAAAAEPAKVNPYLDDKGQPLVVSMSPEEACSYLEKYKGPPLAGVRFNEGASKGWFGDGEAVVGIRKALKADGRLP